MRAKEFVVERKVRNIKDQIVDAIKKDGGNVADYFIRFTGEDKLGFSDKQQFPKSFDVDHPDFDVEKIDYKKEDNRRSLWFYPLSLYLKNKDSLFASSGPYVWLVKLKPNAWLQTVKPGDSEIKNPPENKERVGILRMSSVPAAVFFKPGYDLVGKFYDYASVHKRHGEVKGPAKTSLWQKIKDKVLNEIGDKDYEYKEIEFICVNPKFPDATDPKLQKKMYQGLKQISGVIPLWQEWGDYSEGQASLAAIYKDSSTRKQILALAKKLGVEIDLEQPVSDNYVDRAIRGEHEGQLQESKESAIHLRGLGKFFKDKDPLVDFVPERGTHTFALHPDKWTSTFYSLTNKDPKKLQYYKPAKIDIVPGTLVADMYYANRFYRAKDKQEREEMLKLYKDSLKPYEEAVIQNYKMPELLVPKS